MADAAPKLTAKQALFVEEYVVDLNATQAAIRAGYSEKTAGAVGHENLTKPEIQSAISERTQRRLAATEVTGNRVLSAIAAIAFGDIRKMFDAEGALTKPQEWDDETAASVAGFEVVTTSPGDGIVLHTAKIKRTDRLRALDMLARHHSLYNDKLEVTGLDALADRLARAAGRVETVERTEMGNPPMHAKGRTPGLGEK